jgi:PAS domain S-box-containing protein
MIPLEEAFRDRLKQAVEACSLEKQEIAKRVGLRRPGTLSAWLGDGPDFAIPRGQQLLRLPDILGVSGHWLLTGEGPMRGGEDGLRLQVIRQIVDGTMDDDTAHQLATGTDDRHTGELELIYRTTPMGLALFDRELRYVRISDKLAAINGGTAAEIVGRTLREVVPDLADALEPVLYGVLETGEPVIDGEVSGVTDAAPGIERSFRHSYHAVRDSGGRIEGVSVLVDEVITVV